MSTVDARITSAITRGRAHVPDDWEVQVDCGPEVKLVSPARGLATNWIDRRALTIIEGEGTPLSGMRVRFVGQERWHEGRDAFMLLLEQLVITAGMAVRTMIKRVGERQHLGPHAVLVLEPYAAPDGAGTSA